MNQFHGSSDLLNQVIGASESNNDTARAVTSGLSEAQLNWKPSPEQWSIAQCLEHLAMATTQFDRHLRTALDQARKRPAVSSPPAYKPTLLGGWLAKAVDPATSRKLRAPKIFRPAAGSNIPQSLDLFLDAHKKFIDFVKQCAGVDYNQARLRSPVTPLIRYSLADAFVITVLHGQRHLAQARRVREMPEFPRTER
jgi:DinB family protein